MAIYRGFQGKISTPFPSQDKEEFISAHYWLLLPYSQAGTMSQIKGGSPFFSHQWDQRTVSHHPQHNSSSPPQLCLAFSLCHGDHHCSTLPTNYLSSSFLTIFIHCLCHRLLEYPCLFLVIQFHDKTINPC